MGAQMIMISERCRSGWAALLTRTQRGREDRGDVPGWVLVTVMTAGLVMAIWLVADTQLKDILGKAITSVTKP
jgi:hypothetical protein